MPTRGTLTQDANKLVANKTNKHVATHTNIRSKHVANKTNPLKIDTQNKQNT